MKTINKNITVAMALFVMAALGGCKNSMDDLYQNPEAFTETKIEYLLPTAIDASLRQDYADIYSNHLNSIAIITQVVAGTADPVGGNFYNWTTDKGRWGDYYTNQNKMISLIGMEQKYNYELTDAEKEEYKPYLAMEKVLKAYNTARTTDFFDDIPYTEAFKGQNSLYGQPVILNPKYDSQQSIYYAILDDLKAAAATLSTYTLKPTVYQTHAALTQQDVLFRGDLTKWAKFANSLRLRYAMRISAKDAARARTEINDLISTNAPLVTLNADNVYLYVGGQVAVAGGGSNTQLRAFNELPTQIYAPKLMVDQMTTANDPRLGVFFAKPTVTGATATTIVGLTPSADARNAAVPALTTTNIPLQIASLNPITIVRNTGLPTGIGITAADVNFLLAEASLNGLITGKTFADANTYYSEGIRRSVEAYFDFYIKSTVAGKDAALNVQPSTAVKDALVNTSSYKLVAGTALAQIAMQKWMNTNILQSYETFTEYTRLDLPVLLPDVQAGTQLNTSARLPKRLIIPTSETGSNNANYSAVASKNNQNTKVWWDVN
ncbi:SusD/RagB family nutrient-binding outer membrane lipoprotein [Pedobacter sp. MW01-1-1]|uniref:SusD/RagB family nutrient-binding outer membrane lipoprotein n=1 Tax=Pedobacter sp. MW01-1-1 TaxID=3383027 RepID=UPI003FEF61FD